MKHNLKIIQCLTLMILAIYGAASQSIIGNGNIVIQDRTVDPFRGISVSHGWDIILNQGSGHHMKIETDENIHSLLQTEVQDGVLRIYFEKGVRISKSKRKRIYLTFEHLDGIDASGGSDIKAEALIKSEDLAMNLSGGSDLLLASLHVEDFMMNLSGGSDAMIHFESITSMAVNASGGSDLVARDIEGESCDLQLSGGSDVTLDGDTNKCTITATGGSDVKASGFKVGNCHINLGGGSDALLSVENTLDVTLSGSSDFHCMGSPKVTNQSICKSCDFKISTN